MAQIRLDRVTKTFPGATALRDFTLEIADGEFFVLLGPTGAGKTTTLRLIAGAHYLSDVLLGYLSTIVVLAIVVSLSRLPVGALRRKGGAQKDRAAGSSGSA